MNVVKAILSELLKPYIGWKSDIKLTYQLTEDEWQEIIVLMIAGFLIEPIYDEDTTIVGGREHKEPRISGYRITQQGEDFLAQK